ncbi:Uu.00g037380.m01.CDS01 [Anthostomella pinea]|uniref:Uu.00g037380.m01.CDS01 n=1 Tax=Anthostomella pinea TaxID=933095 RepID=A0AAI8V9L0_9PEZI|nr:Uu.00g037380.m01.CDS01 [Anthostomella pinea]
MRDHPGHEDAMFDDHKYYFPPGALEARQPTAQPGLEVTAQQDELGNPGLQPVPLEETKFHVGGLHEDASRYRTAGAVHADELASQGMQAVPIEHSPTTPPQAWLYQPPVQWTAPPPDATHGQHTPDANYGQYMPTQSSVELAVYPAYQPPIDHQQYPSNWSAASDSQYMIPALASPQPSYYKEEPQQQPIADKATNRRKWMLWAVGGVLLFMAIIGAVVGGIVGSKAAHASDSDSANNHSGQGLPTADPAPSNTTASDTPPKTIRTNSRLAVTGYRNQTTADYAIRLFYQDSNNQLRFVDKESPGANWTTESVILDSLPYEPKENGSISAATYLVDPPKIMLFYVDHDSVMRGQQFYFAFENETMAQKGIKSSLDMYPLETAEDTRISSFFPYAISQDADNQVRWTTMLGQNGSNLSAPWWINDTNLNIEASPGAGMVALPVAQEFHDTGGLVYRSSEGKLTYQIRDDQKSIDADVSWAKGTLSQEIPADTAIGAFVVGRPYDDDEVNTYILYQDDDGVIQVVWQDNVTGWQGPTTYDALSGALKGTDITCLNAGAYAQAGVMISREQDTNRCFFQVDGGRVKEVFYDGQNWVDVGIVPLE